MIEWGKVFVVQSVSRVGLFVTPWTEACQASLSGDGGERHREVIWSICKLDNMLEKYYGYLK